MATDFICNNNDELIVRRGDFFLGTSDDQHIDHIVRSNPGDVLESPLTGVGITDFLNGAMSRNQADAFKREIRLQLEADGAVNVKVQFGDELKIEARYA